MKPSASAIVLLVSILAPIAGAGEPVMIVAFGDSTTAPRTVEGKPLTVYVDILQKELSAKDIDATVINSGIGGHNTGDARARFARDVLAYRPNVVIIQYGINDSAIDVWRDPPASRPRVPLAQYEKNLRDFVRTLGQRKTRVILMTPNPLRWTPKLRKMYGKPPYDPEDADGFNVTLRKYAEAVRKIARDQKVPLLDVYAKYEAYDKTDGRTMDELLLDGMHPNAKGHRMIADLLVAQILPMTSGGGRVERPWGRSGPGVLLNPDCVEISFKTPYDCVSGHTMLGMPDKTVLAAYSPNNPHGPPGATWVAFRTTRDGGKTWSDERRIVRHEECQACGPSLLRTSDGTIHVFYLGFKKHKWKDGNPTPEDQSDLWTIHSRDGGETWTGRQRIYEGYTGATNGAIQTRAGHIVVPFSHYVSDPGRLVARTVVSADGGKAWTLSNALDIGGKGDHDGAIEPAVIQLKDGRVWMLIRTTRGRFFESFSKDDGRTWSPAAKTGIEATSAPGHVNRLADGRLALVWNPRKCARRELWLALSADEGKTWTPGVVLARGKQVTYPFVFEYEPGELWIAYHDLYNNWGRQQFRIVKFPLQAAAGS